MATTIRSDSLGTYGALQVNGNDTFRFGSDFSGQLAGFRNRIINGGMTAHQRSGAITIPGSFTYTLDRWVCIASGANISAIQASYGAGYPFSNALVLNGAAGNTLAQAGQRIESKNISGCAGKNFTVSAELYSTDAATINWLVRYANTTDNFGATTTISTGTVSVPAGGYVNRAFTFTMPAGYANTGVEVVFWMSGLAAGKQFALTNVQLEEGSIATPFEQRPVGLEFTLCQRYLPCVEWAGESQAFCGQAYNTVSAYIPIPFHTPARVAPSGISGITVTNLCLTTSAMATVPVTSVAFVLAGRNSGTIQVNVASGIAAGNATLLACVSAAPAKILFTGCEL